VWLSVGGGDLVGLATGVAQLDWVWPSRGWLWLNTVRLREWLSWISMAESGMAVAQFGTTTGVAQLDWVWLS
jgi:hypothetical protein